MNYSWTSIRIRRTRIENKLRPQSEQGTKGWTNNRPNQSPVALLRGRLHLLLQSPTKTVSDFEWPREQVSPRSPAESDISDSPDLEDLEDEDFALLEAEFLKAKVLVASNQVRVTSHNADEQESDEDEDTNEDEE